MIPPDAVNAAGGYIEPAADRRQLRSRLIPVAILASFFFYYLAIFLSYRPYEIDNPWFLSFSYNLCRERIYSDQFLNVPFPSGMDGTQFFGKIAAYTQCAFLSHFGWQQWPAVILSSSLAVFALWLWSLQLRKLGFSLRFIICFLITAGLSEPFLSAANKFRYESLSFALTSLGILLIVHDRLLVGIFIAALAVEIEPAAMAGLIPCVVVACSINRIDRALITRLIAGMALAGGVYFALHPNIVHLGAYLPQAKPIGIVEDGGTFASYFLRRGRHLPELLFFAIAGGFYWHRRHSFESHYLGIGSLALLLFSILMPHGNPAYMIFSYPLFIAMALAAFRAEHRPWLLVGCVLLYFLPQQIYVAHLSRHLGVRSSDVAEVSQAIQTASATLQIPDPALRIYGDYRLWFAHPHFYRAAAANTLSHIQDADLYLCYDAPPQKGLLEPASLLYCPDLKARLPLRLLGTVPVRDNSLFLYAKR